MGAEFELGYDLLYFAACGIGGETPSAERVKRADLKEVYVLSVIHGLAALTYTALARTDAARENPALMEQWREEMNKAVRKNLVLDMERAQLTAYFEREGIWYMPLKGIILKGYYPGTGLRQMSDNDVLFDKTFAERVKGWFIDRGYACESFGVGAHDAYVKPPVLNFEMHRALFSFDADERLEEYYSDVKGRLVLTDGSFGYSFTKEDYYIYLVAHAYKHWKARGTGLRTLIDFYLYLTAEKGLDRAYIGGELEKLGISDFERGMRELALKAFLPPCCENVNLLTEGELTLLDGCLYAGAYGSRAVKLKTEEGSVTGKAKRKYYKRRLFPPKRIMLGWCEENMPSAVKHRWLLPLAYVWRIFKGGVLHPGKTKKEIRELRRIEREEKKKKE